MAKTEILKGHELEKHIQDKKKILENAKKELKDHFVGIDDIIDQMVDYAEVWFSTPEILSRPMIICLWGPTGVGKTDLIRRFVKLIDFSDRYCEVELANKNTTSWHKSISSILRHNNVESGVPSIVMLDEIQGFRTIDENGHDIQDYELKDIWTLLSDGLLPYTVDYESLMGLLWKYDKKAAAKSKKEAAKNKRVKRKRRRGKTGINKPLISKDTVDEDDDNEYSYYEHSYFKTLLRLDEPVEEIALWDDNKKKSLIHKLLNDKSIFEEEDYTKTLVVISGNLDEAYGFTKNAKEVDLDADLLHAISTRISILDIKQALGERFRPEQISRMGNNHIIYPTLSRNSFEEIICRKIDDIKSRVFDLAEIELTVDKSINTLIYDNGVFPTQGTRPVFSTISEILECNIPTVMVQALIKEHEKASIKYAEDKIIMTVGKRTFYKEFVGTLDAIKRKRDKDINRKTISSVHESGHAIAYAVLFGQTPTQIVSTPISDDMEGFVYFKDMELMSKELLLNKICALLAGHEAERFIFGEDHRSTGNISDLSKATCIAGNMVRRSGMYGNASQVQFFEHDLYNNDLDNTNPQIEKIILEQRERTQKLLAEHENLLVGTVDRLLATDRINPVEFKEICSENGVEVIEAKANDEPRYWESNDKFKAFKKSREKGVEQCTKKAPSKEIVKKV